MGNLLITVPHAGAEPLAAAAHRTCVALVTRLKHKQPSQSHQSSFATVATFSRANGSGGALVVDPSTGNWVATVGVWFHDSGYGSGQEARLLTRFSAIGADRLAREIEGFFVIATGNAASREVVIITDVAGTLHCYSRKLDGATVICTSSLALAGLQDVTLDPVACQEFLQTAAMYETRTFYREVRKLDAGRCHVYRADHSEVRRYWQATDLAADSLDGAAASEAFKASMLSGARKIAAAFRRPAVDLTGGYDSRTAVAAFAASGVPFDTVVAGAADSEDVRVANALARRTGHHHVWLQPKVVGSCAELQGALDLTDGEFDVVEYARIREIHTGLSREYDVSVNGYSGEIGRGYGWEVLMPGTGRREPLDAARIARKRMLNPTFDASLIARELRINPAEHFTGIFRELARGLESLPNTVQYDYVMTLVRCQRWYGRIASSTNQIWPCLSIFLLMSVIRPMLETNTRSRQNSAMFRHALAELSPELANYPLANGYPPAPLTITNLHRFLPVIGMYCGKALGRVRRRLIGAPSVVGPMQSAHRLLASDGEIRELLQPSHMLSAELYEREALSRYISSTLDPAGTPPAQWSLALTLELTLNRRRTLALDRFEEIT